MMIFRFAKREGKNYHQLEYLFVFDDERGINIDDDDHECNANNDNDNNDDVDDSDSLITNYITDNKSKNKTINKDESRYHQIINITRNPLINDNDIKTIICDSFN